MGASSIQYPFTAIVGQDDMKLALCLNAVHPGIGGLLISGERGTAKTTAVRALSGVLGGLRVVELPLNASEDRVVGTLRVDELMKSGERVFTPGVLAEADGNILYVDEVNLLEDHIVDLLLDAAATGVCRVEREGVSQEHPARFVLVGTMNPEEGTLRPQLLDRFGLSVKVSGTLSRAERLELLGRHVDFEADPAEFKARFEEEERELAQRIAAATEEYPHVAYPETMASLAAGICDAIGADGYRADITIMRTARAAAAFDGRDEVTVEDVVLAARFALPHRMKKLPFEDAELTEAMLMKAVSANEAEALALQNGAEPAEPGMLAPDENTQPEADDGQDDTPADTLSDPDSKKSAGVASSVLALPLVDVKAAPFRARPIETPNDRVERARISRKGVRNKHALGGHCIGYTSDSSSGQLHVIGSILTQIEQGLPLENGLNEDCVRYRKIAGRGRRNMVFVVDTSGSMLTEERLALVKGCVISLLEDAYVKRTRVALVGYGGTRARLVLPFTTSQERAAHCIDGMKGGGGTPFVGALAIAAHLIEGLNGEPAELVVLADGRYDRSSHASAQRQIRAFGLFCKRNRTPIHLVDAGTGKKTARRRVLHLAAMLQADLMTLDDLREA